MLVAAYIGYHGTGSDDSAISTYGKDAAELAGQFAVVNAEKDPILSKFKYDPTNLHNFDMVH